MIVGRAADYVLRDYPDDARAAYCKNVSGCNWGSRENYELLLDSSVGLEACADVLCAYISGRPSAQN